jgi:outer membrane lipoprotein-sorting protein
VKFRQLTAIVLAATTLMLAAGAFAMDLEELVGKSIEAQGGAAALKAIQSQKVTGKILTQGMEMPITIVSARPNSMRVEVTVMGMSIVQAFDGTKGWSINPMTGSQDPQPMGEMETKSVRLQADMDGPLQNWEARGWVGTYIGQEDVEGTPTHRLSIDTKQDVVIDIWFDAESFLPIKQSTKMKVDQQDVETQAYPSDYRTQDGVTVAFALETRQGDQVMMNMVFDTVEFGVAVDPSVFAMPAAAPAAPAAGSGN